MRIGGRQELLCRTDFTFFEFDRLGTQHRMREIKIPLMRRRVWALRHVTEIAHKTLVDHFPVVLLGDAIDFHRGAFIYQVKQRGEGAAQTHATSTSVADIKNTL